MVCHLSVTRSHNVCWEGEGERDSRMVWRWSSCAAECRLPVCRACQKRPSSRGQPTRLRCSAPEPALPPATCSGQQMQTLDTLRLPSELPAHTHTHTHTHTHSEKCIHGVWRVFVTWQKFTIPKVENLSLRMSSSTNPFGRRSTNRVLDCRSSQVCIPLSAKSTLRLR